jgi:hypothetical protein
LGFCMFCTFCTKCCICPLHVRSAYACTSKNPHCPWVDTRTFASSPAS